MEAGEGVIAGAAVALGVELWGAIVELLEGAEATATRSTAQILNETFGKQLPGSPLQRSLQGATTIKNGKFAPPPDLTLAHLDYYEQVAKGAIEAGKDTTGIQQVRLEIVEGLRGLFK